MLSRCTLLITILIALTSCRTASADQAAEKIPIILDTDIGTDVDDAFALALALASPEIDLQGVTTVGSRAEDRAWMVCRLLTAVGRREVPVAWGRDPQPKEDIEGQYQYRHHPAPIFNRTSKPVKESAVEFLYAKLKAQPGKLTLVPVGPLTNIARLLTEHPDCKPWIKRIVLMGGAVRVGYEGKAPPIPEWNIKCDIPAARTVFTSGIPLVVAPLDATTTVKLEEPLRRKLFAACTPLTYQVQALYQLWDQPRPTLFDPVAVALVFNEKFCTMEDLHLEVDEKGLTRVGAGKANARVATAIRVDEFLKWYVERVSAGTAALPKAPANESKVIPLGGFPNRVHCFEDYETDIEKRWWMSGKAETKIVPQNGGKRACRGVLTQDFDDLQGDMRTMYTAVVFNPVPGPVMGKNPRLSFRYYLKGTDTLRIQIYSLTNGYHRYLSLTKLPQERWESATVDMTAVRRPDGSGGPLSENERIDDVQFYVDPRAEVLIDDMVLYDAAAPGEKRPFPKSIQFTGTFDTGKQGKEWPGDFEIVDKAGSFWKAAKSVENAETKTPWIRLHLRGERPVGDKTEVFFRYKLTGGDGDSMQVRLLNRTAKSSPTITVSGLKKGEWAEATGSFPGMKRGDRVDEMQFLLPKGAVLLIDDVLLYEPGAE
jgi:inosine-uridine nucleoside N-ribohydrolase